MVNIITAENINEVLNEVIKKLDEAELILGYPGCSTAAVGTYRCEALNSVNKTKEKVRNLIHTSHTLK